MFYSHFCTSQKRFVLQKHQRRSFVSTYLCFFFCPSEPLKAFGDKYQSVSLKHLAKISLKTSLLWLITQGVCILFSSSKCLSNSSLSALKCMLYNNKLKNLTEMDWRHHLSVKQNVNQTLKDTEYILITVHSNMLLQLREGQWSMQLSVMRAPLDGQGYSRAWGFRVLGGRVDGWRGESLLSRMPCRISPRSFFQTGLFSPLFKKQ